MFSATIVESDAFLDMPLTAQALYMHLNMNADNDGFVNPKRVMRMVGANDDDLRILIAKRFLMSFDSGVIVVKHWWINNTRRHDRHTPTAYQNELNQLVIKENKSYTKSTEQMALVTDIDNALATKRQPVVASMQFNAVQSNAMQSKPTATKKQQDFKKSSKRSYAKAVRADEALTEKETTARNRKRGSMKPITELFGWKT